MKQEKHIHKLKRLRYKSGNEIFFCVLPDCNKKFNIALALGKRSLCWRCGEEFIMSDYSLRLTKPHCENCHKPKKEVDISFIPEFNNPIRPITNMQELSLADRLNQTIQAASIKQTTEEVEDEI